MQFEIFSTIAMEANDQALTNILVIDAQEIHFLNQN